jgi:hypothetical protein
MPTSSALFGMAIGLLFVAGIAMPARSRPAPSGRWRVFWVKTLAGLRLVSSVLLVLLLVLPVIDRTVALPVPIRWSIWTLAGLCLFAVTVNAVAGLWVLSPFVGGEPGLEVVAAGRRGTIRSYGWFRLELETPSVWSAQLPYWSIACRPLVVRRSDRRRVVAIILRRERWSPDELRSVRQAAVLCPYSDL